MRKFSVSVRDAYVTCCILLYYFRYRPAPKPFLKPYNILQIVKNPDVFKDKVLAN